MAGRSDDFNKSELWTCPNCYFFTREQLESECPECGEKIDRSEDQQPNVVQKKNEPGTSASASALWSEEPEEDPEILAAFGLEQCPAGHIYSNENGECNFCEKGPPPRRFRTPEPEPLPPGHFNPFRLPKYECTADGWCVGYNPIHPHLRAAHEAEQKAKAKAREQDEKQKQEKEDREREEERENREYREEARKRRNRRHGQGN